MKYVSIDIETTGIEVSESQIIEFAAIIEDSNDIKEFKDLPKYTKIVLHDKVIGTPYAINLNARIFKAIAENDMSYQYVKYEYLAFDFFNWIKTYIKPNENGIITFNAAGKNIGSFDLQHIKNIPNWNLYFKVRHRCIDPGTLFIDWINDETVPSTEDIEKRSGIKIQNFHHALYDAWNVIQVLRTKY